MKIIFLLYLGCIMSSIIYAEEVSESDNLQEKYQELKGLKELKGPEYYFMKEIIYEEQKQDEYLEHLTQELKSALKKGKKEGVIRRVEGNLAEIDKGAIHKVRERDVYYVYDSSGYFKSKLEIGAIADAVSIGDIYGMKENISKGDRVKWIGQRKFFELGLLFGAGRTASKNYRESGRLSYSGGGLIWRWNFRKGWAVSFLWAEFLRFPESKQIPFGSWGVLNKSEKTYFLFPCGIRRNLFYPQKLSSYLEIGAAAFKGVYEYDGARDEIYSYSKHEQLNLIKRETVPYASTGLKMRMGVFITELNWWYFAGPKVQIDFLDDHVVLKEQPQI